MKEQQKNILSQNERTINSRKDIVMENKVDLHIHTTKSDGTRTPKQVLMEAEQLGLHRIAITDHESVQAYPEIKENRHLFSGIIVPGIELKTICQNREIELLHELRTRLISDVVTGQLDVRNIEVPDFELVEELADEAEEPEDEMEVE